MNKEQNLSFGYGQVDITPPVGEFCSFRLAPNKRSLGVHDPLYVHALYLKTSAQPLLMISVDCVAVPESAIEKIKRIVQKIVKLQNSQILLAATHTHNGAETLGEEPFVNNDIQINRIMKASVKAVEQALNSSVAARAGWGSVNVPGIAKNRFEVRIDGDVDKVDDRLDFLKIEDAEGNYKGVLWHFAAHPTTCMKAGYMNSADYYGVVNRVVTEQLGGFAIFFNGACGNINPELGERTFEKSENCGRKIVDWLIEAIPQTQTQDSMEIASNTTEVKIPLTEKRKEMTLPDDREEIFDYFRNIESLELATKEDYDKYWDKYQRLRTSWWQHKLVEDFANIDFETIVINGHRIGNHLILTVPGEIFIEFQFDLQKAFIDNRAIVFGYANGYSGYIPSAESFEISAYETNPTIVHRTGQYTGQKIIEQGKAILNNLLIASKSQKEEL